MVLLTTLLVAFSFPGGSAGAFANKLFDETKQPVMVCQGVVVKLPKLEFDTDDVNGIMGAFRASETMSKMPGVEMTFSDGFLDPNTLGVVIDRLKDAVPSTTTELPGDSVKEGKVTIKMRDDQSFRLQSLSNLSFSHALKIHDSLRPLMLYVRTEDLDERDFLLKISKLVGGRLVTTSKEYSILPYAPEFAKRAEKTLRQAIKLVDAKAQEAFIQAVETRIALIKELDGTELIDALDSTSGNAQFSMTGKPKAAAAFVAWLRIQAKKATEPQPEQSGIRQAQMNIDPRNVVWQKSKFQLDHQLNVTVNLVILDRNTGVERKQSINLTTSNTRL